MRQVLDLMVQRAYGVMSNDVLIAMPLFVFMGYLVERATLIEKLFKSLHLAMARVPGSLAVATIVTCAIFATATGIVGAVVTLMGLLALPAMLRAGYNVKIAAGAITAGGCLGILIPPSVLLIVYGATAGVSVVQLYAGAFFPGIMLAALYVGYVIVLAKIKPAAGCRRCPRASASCAAALSPGAVEARQATRCRGSLRALGASRAGVAEAHRRRASCSSRCCRRWRSPACSASPVQRRRPRRSRRRHGRPGGGGRCMSPRTSRRRPDRPGRSRRREADTGLAEPPPDGRAARRPQRTPGRRSEPPAAAAKTAARRSRAARSSRSACRRRPGIWVIVRHRRRARSR